MDKTSLFLLILVALGLAIAIVAWSIEYAMAQNGPQCVIVKGKVTCCWTTSAGTVCQ